MQKSTLFLLAGLTMSMLHHFPLLGQSTDFPFDTIFIYQHYTVEPGIDSSLKRIHAFDYDSVQNKYLENLHDWDTVKNEYTPLVGQTIFWLNDQGLDTLREIFTTNGLDTTLSPYLTIRNQYGGQNNLLFLEYIFHIPLLQQTSPSRYRRYFDQDGLTLADSIWLAPGFNWQLHEVLSYSYNNGLLSQQNDYMAPFPGQALQINREKTYTYDNQNRILSTLTKNWSASSMSLEAFQKMDFHYGTNDSYETKIVSFWESAISDWEARNIDSTFYPTANSKTRQTGYWTNNTLEWTDRYVETYSDSLHFFSEEKFLNGSWTTYRKRWEYYDSMNRLSANISYSFDLNNSMDTLVKSYTRNLYHGNDDLKKYSEFIVDYADNSFDRHTSEVYSLPFGLGFKCDPCDENEFLMFPNPAKDQINVVLSSNQAGQIELISLDGRRILGKEINDSYESIDLSGLNLNAGMYILRVIQGDQLAAKRLLINP